MKSTKTSARFSARELVFSALTAALISVCAWIQIPLGPIAFTMQTFGVFAAVGLLGGKLGTLAVAVYLLLGASGAPVFTGFSGGFAKLAGLRAVISRDFSSPPSFTGASRVFSATVPSRPRRA